MKGREKQKMTIVRRRVGTMMLMGLMLMPLAAYSDDAADVLAADDRIVALFNASDADGLTSMVVENFISYVGGSPILTDGRDAFVQGVRQGPTFNESSEVAVLGDRTVRINGSTAVIAGVWGQFWKPIDGPWRNAFFNNISTWVKIRGEWKLAMNMTRPIPNGTGP